MARTKTSGEEEVAVSEDPLKELLDILDLEQIELDIFRGRSPDEDMQRVFGGQVAGQALVAAGRTVPADRPVHSLHAYFIRPGDPSVPIVYLVDRVRDGRSFTTRRVSAVQHGRAIFTLSASFHRAEPGPEHQVPMPDAPPPESLPTLRERMRPWADQLGGWFDRRRPIDLRYAGPLTWEARDNPELREPRTKVWLRVDGDLPDDPLLHVCLMTYASDMSLLDSLLLAHGLAWGNGQVSEAREASARTSTGEPPPRGRRSEQKGHVSGASLDHAMWFHRPFRADRWLLYDQEAPTTAGARGLARGQVFTESGELVVSVVQEGLIRVTE